MSEAPYNPRLCCKATPETIASACSNLADGIAEGRAYIALGLSAFAVLTWTPADGATVFAQVDCREYRVKLYGKTAEEIEAELKRILK